MQEEALAELDARADAPDDAYTLCLFAPTGTRASSASSPRGSRTATTARRSCSRRGTAGELKGSGRSISGLSSARRARPRRRSARPALIVALRRSRVRGRPLARRGRPAALRRAVRGGRARASSRPADLSARSTVGRRASARASSTLDLANALRGEVWGQGFPAPAFDDLFDVAEQRIVGEQAFEARRSSGRRRSRAPLRRDPVQPRRPASGRRSGRSTGPMSTNGTAPSALQLVDPALGARLTRGRTGRSRPSVLPRAAQQQRP